MKAENRSANEEVLVRELLRQAAKASSGPQPLTGPAFEGANLDKAEVSRFLSAVMRLAREHISTRNQNQVRRFRTAPSDVREFGYL